MAPRSAHDLSAPRPEPAVWIAAVLAGAVAWLVFRPVLRGEFLNFDDRYLFVENEAYRGLDRAHLSWMFTTTRLGHYAPLAWLSAAIDAARSGVDARAFHRTSLGLHAANTALFALLASALVRRAQPERASRHPGSLALASGAAALLFALHPLRVESVAWITERRGLLAAFFLLVALLLWLRAHETGRAELRSRSAYALSLLALAASLLSKGLGMSFLAVVVLLDVYPLRRLRSDPRRVWIQKVPVLVLCASSAVVSAWAARSAGQTVRPLGEWSLAARIGQAGYGLAYYLRQTLWPAELSAMHELPYRAASMAPSFVAGSLASAALAAALFLARRRAPGLAAAGAAYALLLAPVLGFAQAGPQLVAERYSYLACMPWAALAAGLLDRAWSPPARAPLRAVSGLAVVVALALLAWRTREEIVPWLDSRALWERVLATGEPSAIAHNNLGAMEGESGELGAAVGHLSRAVEIRPDLGRAWLNLGRDLAKLDRTAEAADALRKACETSRPRHEALVELGSLDLYRLGRPADAVRLFREAVAEVESLDRSRFSPLPYLALGVALVRTGEVEEGRRFLELASRYPETRERALRALGR